MSIYVFFKNKTIFFSSERQVNNEFRISYNPFFFYFEKKYYFNWEENLFITKHNTETS